MDIEIEIERAELVLLRDTCTREQAVAALTVALNDDKHSRGFCEILDSYIKRGWFKGE